MAKKKERRFTIKQIIQEEKIANQEILLNILQERGFKTTQATLSRDLLDMGIMRVPTSKGYRYVISEEEGGHFFSKVVGMEISGVYSNQSNIVVRTITGRAQGVALFIDQMRHKNILAKIAGKNAVLIIPDNIDNITDIKHSLEKIAYE